MIMLEHGVKGEKGNMVNFILFYSGKYVVVPSKSAFGRSGCLCIYQSLDMFH